MSPTVGSSVVCESPFCSTGIHSPGTPIPAKKIPVQAYIAYTRRTSNWISMHCRVATQTGRLVNRGAEIGDALVRSAFRRDEPTGFGILSTDIPGASIFRTNNSRKRRCCLNRRNRPAAPNEGPAFDFDSGVSSPGLGAAPPPPDAPDLAGQVDLRVLSAIRRIIRSVDLYSRELAAKARVTWPQLACLLAIAEKEKTTATLISRQVFLSPSTIVGILDRLEAKGLVRRKRDEHDRRVITITITEKGRRLARSAPSLLQDTLTEALRGLPGQEQINIAKSLERVVALMEARRINAASLAAANFDVHRNSDVQD